MPLVHVSENHFKLRKKDRVIGCYLYDKFDEAIAELMPCWQTAKLITVII